MVFFCLQPISPGGPTAGARGEMNGRKLSAGLSALDGPLSECREAVHSEEVGNLFLSLRIHLALDCAPSGNESRRPVSDHLL